jgi:hypothetical protein
MTHLFAKNIVADTPHHFYGARTFRNTRRGNCLIASLSTGSSVETCSFCRFTRAGQSWRFNNQIHV